MMKPQVALLSLLTLLAGCISLPEVSTVPEGVEPFFEAADGTKLVADYQAPGSPNGRVVLFLPGLGTTKEVWSAFASKTRDKGFATLALDFRGHGGSDGDWTRFTQQDFKGFLLDIEATVEYLESRGFEREDVLLVGASIGANAGLAYAAENQQVRGVVLMSPGEDYRGIESFPAAVAYDKPVLILSSREDAYSFDGSARLHALLEESKFIELNGAGHGTNMFSSPLGSEVETAMLDWLEGNANR